MKSSPVAMLAKLARRLLGQFTLEVCRVVTRPLYPEPQAHGTPQHIRFALMSEADLLPHCADPDLELPERHVRCAFARGDLCVGAMDGETLCGYQWLAFRPTPHVNGIWVQFDQRARYSYKKFVRAGYRGQRIAAGLSSHADALCVQRGRTSTVGFINVRNNASWRASARLGSRTAGYAAYVRISGRFIAFRSPGAKRCDFQFYMPATPASANASPNVPNAA